ncbi:alpha/beta hydrolase family protein [Chromobacterium rhizoryzae]|uniref:hypothetical protein n=1 Tax=Chromobacterium rhizoryzae TaxID=1778675 RepID=UPI001D08D4BC|nr:hypothetical protein [Chromobacterium rhizoryzae]
MLIQASRAAAPQTMAADEPARSHAAASPISARLSQTANRADAPAPTRTAPRANPLDGLCAPQPLERLNPEPARQRLKDSALLANFPYSRDLDSLRATQWSPDAELARLLAKGSKLEFQPQQARLMDPESGLVAYVFRNKAEGDIRLVFGGTTSGRGVGGLAQRNLKNLASVARQWRANIGNAAFGGRPACYAQAAQLTRKLQSLAAGLPLMRSGEPGYTVSTGGHSLGGGMAAYAAMQLSTPQRPVRPRPAKRTAGAARQRSGSGARGRGPYPSLLRPGRSGAGAGRAVAGAPRRPALSAAGQPPGRRQPPGPP